METIEMPCRKLPLHARLYGSPGAEAPRRPAPLQRSTRAETAVLCVERGATPGCRSSSSPGREPDRLPCAASFQGLEPVVNRGDAIQERARDAQHPAGARRHRRPVRRATGGWPRSIEPFQPRRAQPGRTGMDKPNVRTTWPVPRRARSLAFREPLTPRRVVDSSPRASSQTRPMPGVEPAWRDEPEAVPRRDEGRAAS